MNNENAVQAPPVETVEGTVEKPYTLRKLRDDDLWPVLDMIGKVMPDQLQSMITELMLDTDKPQTDAERMAKYEQIGSKFAARMLVDLVRNMGKVHDEVYAFLSSVSGLTPETIQGMPFGTAPAMLWEIIKSGANADFFKAVRKLL